MNASLLRRSTEPSGEADPSQLKAPWFDGKSVRSRGGPEASLGELRIDLYTLQRGRLGFATRVSDLTQSSWPSDSSHSLTRLGSAGA